MSNTKDKVSLLIIWGMLTIIGTIGLLSVTCLYMTDSIGLTDSGITTNKLLPEEEQQKQRAWHEAHDKLIEEQNKKEQNKTDIKHKDDRNISIQSQKLAEQIAKLRDTETKNSVPDETWDSKIRNLKLQRRSPKTLFEAHIEESDIPGSLSQYPVEFQDMFRLYNKRLSQAILLNKQGKFNADQYDYVYNNIIEAYNALLDSAFEYCQEQGESKFNLP